MSKSTMISDECDHCEGCGQICLTCALPTDSCECDDEDRQHEDCRECHGQGATEREVCVECQNIVDNCTCEDE